MNFDTDYFFQVIKEGEYPKWPRPENELVIGSQNLGEGYVQFWAYPKESGKSAKDLPFAEALATINPTEKPAVLIDSVSSRRKDAAKEEELLELILVKDGHAWAKTETNVANLEDNIASIVDFGKRELHIVTEHFMTTENVSKEIEDRLDHLESSQPGSEEVIQKETETEKEKEVEPEPSPAPPTSGIYLSGKDHKSFNFSKDFASFSSNSSKKSFNPKLIFIPLLLVFILIPGFLLKDKLIGKAGSIFGPAPTPTPTVAAPTPTITPTPTPAIDRSKYKVRVLNGTPKTGAAGSLGESLKALGWNVTKVGNAPTDNVEKSVVKHKEGLSTEASVLVSDIKDLNASAAATLKKTDSVDLEIVIGRE